MNISPQDLHSPRSQQVWNLHPTDRMLQTNWMHRQLTWGKTALKRFKPTFHFTPKPLALRIMGSQNWWFGDPRTLLTGSSPSFWRVQWFLGGFYFRYHVVMYFFLNFYSIPPKQPRLGVISSKDFHQMRWWTQLLSQGLWGVVGILLDFFLEDKTVVSFEEFQESLPHPIPLQKKQT